MSKKVITITFGDCCENHVGMEKLGEKSDTGFTYEDLLLAKEKLDHKYETELIRLNDYLDENIDVEANVEANVEAYIFVVRNFIDQKEHDEIYSELMSFEWDAKYFDNRRKKVLNKLARQNVCFADTYQKPNYEKGQGTVIAWKSVPKLNNVRRQIHDMLGEKALDLKAEGNFYTDGGVSKTGIGYHGDTERSKVVGMRFGNNVMPLHYQWFHKNKKVGTNFSIDISPADLYVMSHKAVGNDWKQSSKYTLRHATGSQKYTMI